jgi:excisionase family DNA binding protein
MAAGADLARVSYFQMGSKDDPIPFRVPEHADELGRRIAEKQAALVVIDPLIEFIDGSLDTHRSHAVRQAFASINHVAELIGLRTDFIYRLAREGRIPHLRFGRVLRFRSEAIDQWLREQEQTFTSRRNHP